MPSASDESVRGAATAPGSAAAAGRARRWWAPLAAAGLLLSASPWHGAYVGVAFCAVVVACYATALRARACGSTPPWWAVYLVGLGAVTAFFLLLPSWAWGYAVWVFAPVQAPLALAALLSSRRPPPSLAEIALRGARGPRGRLRRGDARVVRRELERAVINHCSVTGQTPHELLAGRACEEVLSALRVSRDDAARQVALELALVDRHCVTGAFDGMASERGFTIRRGGGETRVA